MSIIHFSKSIVDKFPEIFDIRNDGLIYTIFSYMIDSKYRKAAELNTWIKKQLNSPEVLEIAELLPTKQSYDEQIVECLKWVIDHIAYIGDSAQWGYAEKWSEAIETLEKRKGDCEDMHILLYLLCRAKGIPANRMLIWAGDVQAKPTAPTGGHCSLLYFPEEYPINPVFMDACYYENKKPIKQRNKLTLNDKEIIEWNILGDKVWCPYQETWFIFNESFSSSRFRPKLIN